MSPEQAAGGEVDPRGDVWSLGAVLREMLAARTPAIDRVLSLMLAPDPEDRYPDADALLPDLARLERGAAGLADGRAPRRSGWLLGLTLLLGAVAVARSLLEPWGQTQDLEIPSPDDPLDAGSAKSSDPPVTRY